jgi:hypothetical protein
LETSDRGKTWHSAQGEKMALPITQADSPTLVHDYASEGKNVYVKDIQFNRTGKPVILYVTSKGYESGPSNGPRAWQIARWSGNQWRFSTITQSDNNYDMGSLYLEATKWRLIAPTEPGPQSYNPGGEICTWISEDEGETWQRGRQLTRSSPRNHAFVRRPINAHPEFYAFWADGHGRQPSESRLYFSNQQGDVFQLPATMTGKFSQPLLLLPTNQQSDASTTPTIGVEKK